MTRTPLAILLIALAAALTFAAPPSRAAAPAATATVTIETDSGALLVSGPKTSIALLRDSLAAAGAAGWNVDQIAEYIRKQYPGQLDAQIFMRGSQGDRGREESFEMPLRRAILYGLLPPIEGLSQPAASDVLTAAGIASIAAGEWDAKNNAAKTAIFSVSSGRLAVLSGTAPGGIVKIFFIKGKARDGAEK